MTDSARKEFNEQMNSQMKAVIERVAAALKAEKKVVFAFDFDGTLSPFVDDPEAACIDDHCHKGLKRLGQVHSNVEHHILTGREMKFIIEITPDDLNISGTVASHGLECRRSDGTLDLHEFEEEDLRFIEALKASLKETLSELGLDHSALQIGKHGSVSFKSTVPEHLKAVIAVMDMNLESQGTFHLVMEGHQEAEVRPKEIGKDTGIEQFIRPGSDDLLVFAGDSLGPTGTDSPAARLVNGRGENGIVLRVENGRLKEEDIPADCKPAATFETPAALGQFLHELAEKCNLDLGHLSAPWVQPAGNDGPV